MTTPEAAEVLAINTLAPFIINSRLRRLPRPRRPRPQSLSIPDPNPDPNPDPDPDPDPNPDPDPTPTLNPTLARLLEASPAQPRFVVNVSAMEGKFYRYKTPNHPHTNMAKAALHMIQP